MSEGCIVPMIVCVMTGYPAHNNITLQCLIRSPVFYVRPICSCGDQLLFLAALCHCSFVVDEVNDTKLILKYT